MSQSKSYFQNVETMDEDGIEQDANGTLSKQFQPKKYKDGNRMWMKDSDQDDTQTYSYTPFKASTLRNQTTPKPTRDAVHTGTLRPPKASPFVYDPPSAPSTPRVTRARPESAAGGTMTREQKLTWGRMPQQQQQQHFRSASSMSHGRTLPRPNEFTPINGMATHQRYPSFTNIPRNDPMDNYGQMHPPHPYFIPPPPQMISRPPSAVPSMGHPNGLTPLGAHTPFVTPMIDQKPSPRAVATQLAITSKHVNWNWISLICCAQVLVCLAIFGVGVARIIYGAQWAIGIEIIFATFALLPALIGLYAVRKGNYSAALFCFSSNALQMVFATIPFIIGLFPVFPIIFPKVEKQWLLSDNEPILLDLILSALVALQTVFAFILSIMGCKAGGSVIQAVDEMKLHNHMKAAFEESPDVIPFKQL